MSYLVYCPTCRSKISVNAKTCPNCGESKFFKLTKEAKKEKCTYFNGIVIKKENDFIGWDCNGTGYYYSEHDNIMYHEMRDYTYKGPSYEYTIALYANRGRYDGPFIYLLSDSTRNSLEDCSRFVKKIKPYILSGDYCLLYNSEEATGGYFYKKTTHIYPNRPTMIAYNKVKCPHCKGTGVATNYYDKWTDIRERVVDTPPPAKITNTSPAAKVISTPPPAKTKIYYILQDLCLSCGICQPECPINAIIEIDSENEIYMVNSDCNGCGICANICITGAIRVK